MKLTDIAPISAEVLNAKMRDKLGWNIRTEGLKVKDAEVMLESVTNKLNAVRGSSKVHVSERDPNYTGMLMAQQVLESYIAERAVSKAQQQAAAIAMHAPKSELKGASKEMSKMSKKELEKFAKTKHKGLPKHVGEAEELDEKFDKPTKVAPSEKGKHSNKTVAELRKQLAKLKEKGPHKKGSKEYGLMKELQFAIRAKTGWGKVNESIDAAIKRMINEDEVTQAQSVMAAKDMVDSLQGMLEDISKMVNEQLPPLTDSIRSNIGDSQASTFQGSVQQTLNDLLSQVQGARESVNNAVLGLTGQAPAPVETPAPDMGGEEPADDFGASDAAAGGELPLGREKR